MFKKSAFVSVFVFLGIHLHAQIEWLPLRINDEKKATAYFPGEILEIKDTLTTPLGLMPFTTYYSQDDEALSGNRLYMLTIVDYPEGSFPKDSIQRKEAFFNTTMEAAASSVGGTLKFSSPLESDFYGYIFRIDYGEERPTIVRNQAYLVGDTYYHQQIFSFKQDEGEKSQKRFFTSFNPTTVEK